MSSVPRSGELDGPGSRAAAAQVRVIEPRSGWRLIDFRELVQYRDLFFYLTWRDIKVRYAQSVLGIGWAVIQPLAYMVVFTFIFGNYAKVDSEGAPYAIFTYAALVPWTYFSQSLTGSANSLVQNVNMLSKVYFPRLILPLSAVLARLLDFLIALAILVGLMVWYRIAPTFSVFTLPLLIAMMMLCAAGFGMWLTALAIQYRDVRYGMSFVVQLLMYATPVVYPVSAIPDRYRLIYGLNPMAGMIEGFRSAFLKTNPFPWDLVGIGFGVTIGVFVTGALYFRRTERVFADVA